MPRREARPDLADDRGGKPAMMRCQLPDGSLVWVYQVPRQGAPGFRDVLMVRLDGDGEVFVSL